MKKIFSILSIGLSALALSALTTGCVEEIPEVIEELELSNMLTPSSISGVVDASTGTTVTFTWKNSNAVVYRLQVYGFKTGDAPEAAEITADLLSGMTPALDVVVQPSESGSSTSYTAEDLEPEMSYYARVCAMSSEDPDTKTVGDSEWAFTYPIDTYSVMDQLPSFSVKERTSSTITVQWTVAEGDTDGINQVRVFPHPTDASQAFLQVDVASGATEAVVGKLNPSEKYTVQLHFNSANRGQMFVWTTPDWEGVQDAADTADLKRLLREAGTPAEGAEGPLRIRLTNTDTPYDLDGTVDVLGPVEILGQQTTDGVSPVVNGKFMLLPSQTGYKYWNHEGTEEVTIAGPTAGATSIRFEAIEFDGVSYTHDKPLQVNGDFPAESPLSIHIINCEIHGYKHGFFYDNSKVATYTTIEVENNVISDILGDGGDGFDIRAESIVKNITMKNNTFSNGMRTFIRIDKGTLESLTFENNTVNNVASFDNSNNKGLFNIRAALSGAFTIKNNLFLNLNGVPSRTVMFPAQATAFPTEVSGNYYYNLADTFFYADSENKVAADEFPESKAIAGGGSVLSADPCENSARGIFNVTDASVLAAKAGDPRWLVAYVPQPMADLEPVQYGEWNLTDKSSYGQSLEETTVINNTKFIVASNPINILDEGMEFSAEATLQYGGVPSDCAIAFMVQGPGSIFASAIQSGNGTANDHITIALGDTEGNAATVSGSVFAGAENQKIVFDEIPAGENRLVYIYACGPIVLTDLEWSDDINTGSSALADPVVTPDVATPGALTLSWPAVENAGSYTISFGAKEADAEYAEDEYIITGVTGTSYTWDAFPSGTYTVNVQAIPAEPDKFENSMIVGTEVTVAAPALTNMSSGTLTQDDFRFISAIVGTDKLAKGHVITYKNFMFTENKGEKVSFGVDSNFGAYYSTGGSSSVKADAAEASQTIRFLAAGAGKLTVVATSTSSVDPEKPRNVGYGVNGKKSEIKHEVPGKPSGALDPATSTFSFDISAAAGDAIDIYGDANIYVMNVTWEPSGQLPPVAGLTPVTEATTWGSDEWAALYEQRTDQSVAYGKDFNIADEYFVVNNFMIYSGASDTKFRVGADNEYIQLASKSCKKESPQDYDKCFLRFRAAGNGTLTVSARHTSGTADGAGERLIFVAVGGSADAVSVGTVLDETFDAGVNVKFTEHKWNITASNGDAITIFENDALRIDKVTWTPAE